MDVENEMPERQSPRGPSPQVVVVGVASFACRTLAVLCALTLGFVMFKMLLNESTEDGIGLWVEGGIFFVITVVFLILLLVSMWLPLVVFTSTWWEWLASLVPVLLAQGAFAYWTRDGGDSPDQGTIADWFLPLFIAIPVLLLVGQVTGGAADKLIDAVRRRNGDALDRSVRKQLQEFQDQPVRGHPGLGQDGQDTFGDRASAGSLGERRTAAIIDEWAECRESVTVFHGLRFPGSVRADVDHAIVAHQRVALLDSKNWKSGHYAFDRHGHVVRNGQPFTGGDVHMADAVRSYASSWAEHHVKVTGWIVLASQADRTPPTVDNSYAPPELRLVTTAPDSGATLQWVDEWLHESAPDAEGPLWEPAFRLLFLREVDESRLER